MWRSALRLTGSAPNEVLINSCTFSNNYYTGTAGGGSGILSRGTQIVRIESSLVTSILYV